VGDELYFDGTVWNKLSASGGDVTITLPTSSIDGRVIVGPTSNQSGGAKFGMAATADGRVLAWGDVGSFAFNPVGDAYGAYELFLPWDTATVSVEAIYVGLNYALVLTDEATENLYAIGGNDDGQCGQGNTTTQTALVKVTGLTGVHIDSVVTEANRGNAEKFWFAITSTGAVYSCGYSGAQHVQGYNNTADLTTPRLMTQSDGTTPLADIVEISADTAYAPVWARDSSNRAWRWGAGTNGAHGNNSTSAITWPALLETSPGSGTARTDIAQVVTTGSAVATGRAASWIRTTAGKIECAGNQLYGIGDAATLANTNATTFQTAAGAIDALTVSALYAGGGEYYNCVAITSTGQGYLVGYVASYGLLGDGGTTNLNTFTIFSGLPTSFAGNLTSAAIAGGNSYTAIYLEATISGVKTLASIGYDGYYATAKNVAGTAAANQTWGAVQGAWGTLASWGVFGGNQEYGLWTLNSDGELRYCGRNDQGQAGMRHAPGVMASIPILQRVDLGVPRLLKPPVNRGAYSAVVEYSKQDVVTQSGSSWIYVNETAGTGNAPPTLPTTSNSYWQLLAAKGDTGITTDLANDVNGNAYSIFGVTNTYNDQTGTTYTLQATDTGNVLTFDNAADVTVTVPATLPVGFSCTVIQLGAGQVIFTGGATINHVQGHDRTFGQYAMAILAVYANSGGSAAVACLSGATDN
jgi:alpha-tubulin suppressor-like RCC1 family protein